MLLDKPLDSHPIEPNVELPSPACLKRKIIIKNKKKHHHHHHHKKDNNVNNTTINTSAINISFQQDEVSATPTGNGDVSHHPPLIQVIDFSSFLYVSKIFYIIFFYSKFVKVPKIVQAHQIQIVPVMMNQYQDKQLVYLVVQNLIKFNKQKRLKLVLKFQHWLIMFNRYILVVLKMQKVSHF